jgi:type IV secretion system protein VirB11
MTPATEPAPAPQLELSVGPSAERDDQRSRLFDALTRYLGPAVTRAFADEDVTEVYLNPQDCVVRVDTRSKGKVPTGEHLPPHRVEMFLNAVAATIGTTITRDQPRLQAELPAGLFRGSRLQGFVPPVTTGPSFTIRKPPAVVYSLDEYVAAGILSEDQRAALRTAVSSRWSILVVGGTNSGKTTLVNAILREITDQFPQERIVILEDTVELQCSAPDHLAMRTGPNVTLAELVRSTLRTSPDRIVVGEVRGPEALDLLDAWATGHPGGVATVHASTPEGALLRLDRLAQRANVPSQAALIAEAVDLIALIEGGNRGRRVSELVRVNGLTLDGQFILNRSPESTPCRAA